MRFRMPLSCLEPQVRRAAHTGENSGFYTSSRQPHLMPFVSVLLSLVLLAILLTEVLLWGKDT